MREGLNRNCALGRSVSYSSYLAQFIEQSEGRAHATYLVTGYIERNKEANGHAQDGVNGNGYLREEMELDGAPSSSRDTAAASQQDTKERLHCVMLVPQEELDERLALFSQILSNEVYSIEPSRLPVSVPYWLSIW